ncbi:reverse transcriptase [Caerostris extrusa]|uniref:Reverse transcriptase n=1 Tax=Caerostris extrusa TaxID=172846 RepID=A0AAV4N3H5_CAEEX|nr:reverse transcriptase [Caerostris extrusa]
MRFYIENCVKECPECCQFKATNQKSAGLLRAPEYAQRFETLSIDLFGSLPEVDSYCGRLCHYKWMKLFPLVSATTCECATKLIEEVFLRYGMPRKLISDICPQFVRTVLQQICCTLDIDLD